MTTRSKRDRLKAQLLDTRRILKLVDNHPVMSLAYSEKETELEEMIQAIPLGEKENEV